MCLPGDCFRDLVWPSPNLLHCAVAHFLSISSFLQYFSSSLCFCRSPFLTLNPLSCFVCSSEAASGGVLQGCMIIHPGRDRELFLDILSLQPVFLSVIKFINTLTPFHIQTRCSSESRHESSISTLEKASHSKTSFTPSSVSLHFPNSKGIFLHFHCKNRSCSGVLGSQTSFELGVFIFLSSMQTCRLCSTISNYKPNWHYANKERE